MSFLESEFFMLRVPLLCVVCLSLSLCAGVFLIAPSPLSTLAHLSVIGALVEWGAVIKGQSIKGR